MPGRILLVDAVATNRIILKVKLIKACYNVLQASSGKEALKTAQKDRPDLILLDMALPDLDCLQVCRRLKADHRTRDIPVIFLASQNDPEEKLAALKAGAEEFMPKPVDDMGLLARIRSLLRARGITSELALREDTSQALGFAEPAAEFLPPKRICLVAADKSQADVWRGQLQERLQDTIEIRDGSGALSDAGPVPDLFVVTADLDQPGAGLLLLSELRSRTETRHAGVVVAVAPDQQLSATMALDLGASDLVTTPINADELVLRLNTVMDRKRQADRLRNSVRDGLQMAVTDPLTELYNRRYALSHLARIRDSAFATNKSFAVILADLDHFKRVNDTYGHAAGDAVLKKVAARLSSNLRSVDLVARYGGEEFLIILPEIDPDAAERTAERLKDAIGKKPIALPGQKAPRLNQTISIGLAIGNGSLAGTERDLSELLERADRALYASKAAGRDCVTVAKLDREAA